MVGLRVTGPRRLVRPSPRAEDAVGTDGNCTVRTLFAKGSLQAPQLQSPREGKSPFLHAFPVAANLGAAVRGSWGSLKGCQRRHQLLSQKRKLENFIKTTDKQNQSSWRRGRVSSLFPAVSSSAMSSRTIWRPRSSALLFCHSAVRVLALALEFRSRICRNDTSLCPQTFCPVSEGQRRQLYPPCPDLLSQPSAWPTAQLVAGSPPRRCGCGGKTG